MMPMRSACVLAIAGVAFATAGCDGNVAARTGADSAAEPASARSAGFAIPCALDGASAFDSTCTVERYEVEGAMLLTVNHPDGGFRRFEQLPDGAGLAAVAGADEVTQSLSGDTLEIALVGNRYRFPATRK
mgnify:FL=1